MNAHLRPRVGLRVPAACVIAALLACAPDPDPDVAPPADSVAGAPADATVPSDSIAPAGADTAWTAGDTNVERPQAGIAILHDVRTARHGGFDRIVLDFGDSGIPSYSVAYVDRPVRQCGSGEEVALAGDAWLSIELTPANAHTEAGEPTVQERERAPRLPTLLELKLICDFEAHVEWVAGVASPERYRVLELREPDRLVIDIRHAGGE